MPSAWEIDEDDIPEDKRLQTRKRRLRIAGLGFWGLFAGSLSVLLVTDTSNLTIMEFVSLAVLSLGGAIVAVGVGVLMYMFLQKFAILGQIVFGLLFLLIFFVALPPLVSLVIENVSLFDGISTKSDQPVLELLKSFIG